MLLQKRQLLLYLNIIIIIIIVNVIIFVNIIIEIFFCYSCLYRALFLFVVVVVSVLKFPLKL